MSKLHRSEFLKDIKAQWPELTDALNAEAGLLHLEMDVVRQFAQRLIEKNFSEDLANCFAVVEKHYLGGNEKLKNAIDVSFVEGLVFRNERKHKRDWAWELLPASLKTLYSEFHSPSKV